MKRLAPTLLTLLIALIPWDSERTNKLDVSVEGTILAFIPARDGIIVASDSRETLGNGLHCDGQDKIFTLTEYPLSVFAMSGSYGLLTAPANEDACAFLRSARVKVDFRAVAKTFLESRQGPITKDTLNKLEALLREEIEKLLPTNPELVGGDGGILSFSFVKYVHQQKTVTYAAFEITSVDKRNTTIQSEVFTTIHNDEDELQNIRLAGKTVCFLNATSAEGRKVLGSGFLRSYDYYVQTRPTVGEFTQEDAVLLARDVIDSTVRYSTLFPGSDCGTGGPTKILALNAHVYPVKIQ